MKKVIEILSILCLFSIPSLAQKVISGTVSDENGKPINGVEFYISDNIKKIGSSDEKGKVIISAIPDAVSLLSYIVYTPETRKGKIQIDGNTFILVIKKDDRVINLGHDISTTEKESTISSATIGSEELQQSSEVNVAKALYGKLAGLSVMQPGGINSVNSPSLLIRGKNTFNDNTPLVLVDGFERDIDYISLAEIESISVLKDATAAALYGVRGANGVIVVKTKRGAIGKTKVTAQYKYNTYVPFREPEMADGYSYAQAYNEALANDGFPAKYSNAELQAFKSESNKFAYPNVNWNNQVYKDFSTNHQFDLTASGGGNKFRYFTAATYSNDQGLFKPNDISKREDYKLSKLHLNLRSNLDANITKTTLMQVSLLARLSEFTQPRSGAVNIASGIINIPSAAFPVYSPNGKYASTNFYGQNPVAMVNSSGFTRNMEQSFFADLRLKQDLSTITEGLTAEVAMSHDFYSLIAEFGNRSYLYEVVTPNIDENGNITTSVAPYGEDTPMDYGDNLNTQFMNDNLEGKINYSKQINNYNLNASLVYDQSSYFGQGRNNTNKRQSYMAYLSGGFKEKYLLDAVLNYSGSSVMPENDRFRFFPAISGAWIVSSEEFMSSSSLELLKIRGSYGLSGSDSFSNDLFRQFYINNGTYYFTSNIVNAGGSREGTLPVVGLNYELVKKANLGIDLMAFKKRLSLTTDLFYEYRNNILVDGSKVISSVIGIDVAQQINGEVKNKGIELTSSWADLVGKFNYRISGNITFVRNEIIENNEGFVPFPYLSKIGNSLDANYGLEAIGFFNDVQEIASSPKQVFSDVKPGDIKYKDQNSDNIIDENDVVKYGNSGGTPEIYYGFQINLEYKNFGFNAQLQGVANRTIFTNTANLFFPLKDGSNISTYYLEDQVRWTESTKGTATVPRLTTVENLNNFRPSTLWFRNGAYLKLRNIELYYNVPESIVKGVNAKLFVRGANLFSLDNLKKFDPENYQANYPSLSSYTIGATFCF